VFAVALINQLSCVDLDKTEDIFSAEPRTESIVFEIPKGMRRCPFCGHVISEKLIACPYCDPKDDYED
jgi:hypothetical protein